MLYIWISQPAYGWKFCCLNEDSKAYNIVFILFKNLISNTSPGAYPGFPIGGGANHQGGGITYYFAKFSKKKLYKIEKNLGLRGRLRFPPYPPLKASQVFLRGAHSLYSDGMQLHLSESDEPCIQSHAVTEAADAEAARVCYFYRPELSWAKAMFLQASVILLTGGGVPGPGTPPRTRYPPRPGTPLTRYTPQDQVAPHIRYPPTRYTPQTRYTPPGPVTPPGSGTPPRPGTPPNQVHQPPPKYGQRAAGTHPTGMHSC